MDIQISLHEDHARDLFEQLSTKGTLTQAEYELYYHLMEGIRKHLITDYVEGHK